MKQKIIQTLRIEHYKCGFMVKSYFYYENNQKYYIIEVYKDGALQFFDEKKIEGQAC